MSSRRRSVSGSAVRVVKRKLSPSPPVNSRQTQESAVEPPQSCEMVEPVFTSPLKSTKRRLSALGGPATRVKTPSKKPFDESEDISEAPLLDKENTNNSNDNVSSVFNFCRDNNRSDGNASDEYSRDSLDSAHARRLSCSAGDRRSSTSSYESASSLSSGDDVINRNWCSKDFSIGKAIGKGKFGNVYLAKVRKSRSTVALKVLFKAPMRAANCVHSLRREVEIQCRLKHKNITQLYGYFHDSKNVYLLLEYLQHGELFKYIDKKGGRVDEITCRGFMRDIVSAVSYLHTHNVIHRDLKPENVLFDITDGKMNLRIADFGCAVVMSAATNDKVNSTEVLEKQLTVCGTPEYLAPEMLLECGHGREVDLWALGIFIYELLVGKTPFVENSSRKSGVSSTYDRIRQHVPPLFPLADSTKNELFSDETIAIVDNLLNPEPERRRTAQELLSSPWLNMDV